MLKQFFALVRGRSNDAAEVLLDANALAVLRQQIRDCAEAVTTAKRAVAIAIAQNGQEVEQHRRLAARIDDLESRTLAALEQDKTELAHEAAQTIALLEAEKAASEEAQSGFGREIDRLKATIRSSETRLRALQRGQRIATAVDRTQRLRDIAPANAISTLRDAENTLARLRSRQAQMDAAAVAMAEMEQSTDPAAISEKLAAAGCGAPIVTTAEAVLERLSAKLRPNA